MVWGSCAERPRPGRLGLQPRLPLPAESLPSMRPEFRLFQPPGAVPGSPGPVSEAVFARKPSGSGSEAPAHATGPTVSVGQGQHRVRKGKVITAGSLTLQGLPVLPHKTRPLGASGWARMGKKRPSDESAQAHAITPAAAAAPLSPLWELEAALSRRVLGAEPPALSCPTRATSHMDLLAPAPSPPQGLLVLPPC